MKWTNGLNIHESENNWTPGAGEYMSITIILKYLLLLKRLGQSEPNLIRIIYRKRIKYKSLKHLYILSYTLFRNKGHRPKIQVHIQIQTYLHNGNHLNIANIKHKATYENISINMLC